MLRLLFYRGSEVSGDLSKVAGLLRGEPIQPNSLQLQSLHCLLPTALSFKWMHVNQSHMPAKTTALHQSRKPSSRKGSLLRGPIILFSNVPQSLSCLLSAAFSSTSTRWQCSIKLNAKPGNLSTRQGQDGP